MRKCEQELKVLRLEKEEKEKMYMDENSRITNLITEKDSLIKELEGAVAAEKLLLESLNSRFEESQHELTLKEDLCRCLRVIQENLEKQKGTLQSSNNDYARSLLASAEEIKGLEDLVRQFVQKLLELDKYSLVVSGNVVQLYLTFGSWYKLVQQEKNLISKWSECQFDELHDRFLHVTSENSAVRSDNEDLKNKVSKLQKLQEELMVQHAEECRLGEEKAQTLESEAQTPVSEKEQLEMLMIKLQQEIEHLSGLSSFLENKRKDLLLKISTLESENQDIQEKLHTTLLGKEVETLQKEISMYGQHADSLEKQVSWHRDSLEVKEQFLLHLKDKAN